MKIKNMLLLMTFAVCGVVPHAFGLKITVRNLVPNNQPIEVDPVWTGAPKGWMQLGGGKGVPFFHEYNSSLHHLKGLRVRYNNQCYYYNCEQYSLRGTGSITITVDKDLSSVLIEGYRDIVRQQGTKITAYARLSSQSSSCP